MTESEIKKLTAELERLRHLVYYDELTGILNRRGFKEEAEKIFNAISFKKNESERRNGVQVPFSILFLDLDDFKKINDSLGHEAGDKVLMLAAKILKNLLRKSDICGRWGGEEFVAALIGADETKAKRVAEKLRGGMAEIKIPSESGENKPLTFSCGIAAYDSQKDLAEIIDNADKAMYAAKTGGKNRTVVYDVN